jgi:hypothetical protein
MIDIFIPSYKRSDNLKTLIFFKKIGYDVSRIHIFIDSEAEDKREYEETINQAGANLFVFNMEEARTRYDYVHRASVSRRSAGQARNMFYDYAKKKGIDFYMVQDDDTLGYEIKKMGRYKRMATINDILNIFNGIKSMMVARKIGCFGTPQTGDFIGGTSKGLLINKVMNTTFILTKYIYRGEKGVQDNDTSQFVGIMNEGLFTGSLGDGLCLKQTPSATAKGGLTELYNECKLLNKSLILPIQFPSLSHAERQIKNGGRLHHSIKSKNLFPKLLKVNHGRDNIAWDSYKEDYPFTCEPKR